MASSNAGKGVSNANSEKEVTPTAPASATAMPTPAPSNNIVENPAPATAANLTNLPSKSESICTATKTSSGTQPAAPSLSTPPQTVPVPPRATSLPSAASEASVKNRSSREEKSRKKDDKSVDHVLRALNSLNTTEEKLAAMCKKYADIFDEHRKLQLLNKQTEKKCSMMQREKEQLQAEHSKAILTRSRLENLCRELQRQNKAIKDESLLKIREEEEKRKEVSTKFQTTMNEITSLMQQNNDKNLKLRDDNIDMTAKLKNICEQYELRQQQVERISKQMQLEQQLADAKLGKLKIEMAAERELLQREKQTLLLEIQQYQQRCTEFQTTEVNLRNQISMYNEKYDEFQKALARSNDVFGGFKGEMEKMSKKICKLEKETSSWKQRWERSHNALLEMAADKQKSEQELAVVSRQLATLQNLCRTLQTERSNLLAKLKSFPAGGHESLEKSAVFAAEKSSQQFEEALNHTEQPMTLKLVVDPCQDHCCNQDLLASFKKNATPVEVPTGSIASTIDEVVALVTDPSQDHCFSQDILASFKGSIAVKDAPTVSTASTIDRVVNTCEEPVPVPVSPLPDVVGTINNLTCDKKPDVNSDLCQRLENTSIEPCQENVSGKKVNVQQNITNGLAIQDKSVDPSKVDETFNQPSVIVENSTSQLAEVPILNGSSDVLTNGSSSTDSVPQIDVKEPLTPLPKPPTTKSSPTKVGDSGKKLKESTKKKKK